jgi:8-amino-7-oxononanoate synthase
MPAIILGSHTLKQYLINYARPLIYTTFISYPGLISIRCSYTMLWSGQTDLLQKHLHCLTQTLFTGLMQLHRKSSAARKVLKIPSACPQSPIFAIQAQRPRELAVVPPTVPLGTERVRVCLHAGNTVAEIAKLLLILGEWCDSKSSASFSASDIETQAKL